MIDNDALEKMVWLPMREQGGDPRSGGRSPVRRTHGDRDSKFHHSGSTLRWITG